MSPLAELSQAVFRGERPPLAWVVAHARDGSIAHLWAACDDGTPMMLLAARAHGAPVLAPALLALIDAAPSPYRGVLSPRRVTVVGWLQSVATGLVRARRTRRFVALLRAICVAWGRGARVPSGDALAALMATSPGGLAAAIPFDACTPMLRDLGIDIGEAHVWGCVENATRAIVESQGRSAAEAEAYLADIVRRTVPCPPLAPLLAPHPNP